MLFALAIANVIHCVETEFNEAGFSDPKINEVTCIFLWICQNSARNEYFALTSNKRGFACGGGSPHRESIHTIFDASPTIARI